MARISDSHGEMMDRAGYDRAGNLNDRGWSEHESRNGYDNTRDRMERHLSQYGKDSSYTNAFNERNSNGWGGASRSSISGAANNARNSIASSRNSTLTNNSLAQVTSPSASIKGPYSPNIDPNYTPNIFDKYAPENFQHVQNIAAHDFINDSNRATALNAFGGTYSQPVAEGMISKATSPAKAALGVATGALVGKLGDVANGVAGKQNRSALSKEQQAMYDGAYQAYSDVRKEHRSDAGDTFRGFVVGAIDAVTNPIGALSALNSVYSDNKATMETLDDFKDVAEFQAYKDERESVAAKARAEREANRGKFGGKDVNEPRGILGEMQQRATQGDDSSRYQNLINAVPTLTNFWKNITIK